NVLPCHEWKGVAPFGRRPEVPKFPKQPTHACRHKVRIEEGPTARSQVALERREPQTEVDGVEEKNEANPHGAKKEGAKPLGHNEGHGHKNRARKDQNVLCRAREYDRPNGSVPPAEGLDEIGREKNSRPYRGIGPGVGKPSHRDREEYAASVS